MSDYEAAQTFLSGAYVESIGKVTRYDFARGMVAVPNIGGYTDEQRPPNDTNSLPHTVFSSSLTLQATFVPNPGEVYLYQSGSTGNFRGVWTNNMAVMDGSQRTTYLVYGDLKSMYVPFCEVVRVWSPGATTGMPALTIPGPQLVFFSGNSQTHDVPAGGFGSIVVAMQAIGGCGVPASRRAWDAQKRCLCMDRLTVSFGRSFWRRWYGGTGECDAVMRAGCTGAKLDSKECACIREEAEFGDGVECLGPVCSRDFSNEAYRPGNVNSCSVVVCKQLLGDGSLVGEVTCGGVKYNVTPDGEVTPLPPGNDDTASRPAALSDVTSVAIEVWLIVVAAALLFIAGMVALVGWYRNRRARASR